MERKREQKEEKTMGVVGTEAAWDYDVKRFILNGFSEGKLRFLCGKLF